MIIGENLVARHQHHSHQEEDRQHAGSVLTSLQLSVLISLVPHLVTTFLQGHIYINQENQKRNARARVSIYIYFHFELIIVD